MEPVDDRRNMDSCVPRLFVRGFAFPGSRWFCKENIEATLDFQPRDTDILISSFPKSGTNWAKYIVYSILTMGQKPLTSNHQLTYEAVPFLELCGVALPENMSDPRPFQCHLPYHMIPSNPRAKYIYILRNPKDALVSFYHFVLQTNQLQITFDEYFEAFIKGLVSYGDYFDHVLSWYEHRHDSNVLLLSYEQLHSNIRDQLLRISKFLGDSYHQSLLQDGDLMTLIMKQTSFDEMKKLVKELPGKSEYDLEANAIECSMKLPAPRYDVHNLKIVRKGQVGDWKNHLSDEQSKRMDQKMMEKFGNTDIIQMFNP